MVRVGGVWDRATAFAGQRFGALAIIALLLMVLPDTVSGALAPLRADVAPVMRMAGSLSVLAASLLSLWGHLAVTALVLEPAASAGVAVRRGGGRVMPMFGATLLVMLLLVILTAPIALLAFGAGGVSMDMAGMRAALTGEAQVRIALAGLVTALLLLWIGARLTVLAPVVVAERRGLRAIPRAFALTRGLGLKLMGVLLLYVVVVSIVGYATRTVAGTVLTLVLGGEGRLTLAGTLTALAVAVVSAVFSVLAAVFMAQLYRSVRAAREGAPAA